MSLFRERDRGSQRKEERRDGGEKGEIERVTKSRPSFTSTAEAQCSSKVGEIEVKCGAEGLYSPLTLIENTFNSSF